MAGRGPAPKASDRRARTNSEAPTTVLRFERGVQPDLPPVVPWPDRTREWWALWGASPIAETFTFSDWEFLLDTALVHADVWGNFNLDRMPELRLRVAKFGATPEDRARLKISFAAANEAEDRAGTRQPSSRTLHPGLRLAQ